MGYSHQIEKSKTSAAGCKRCGAKIQKDTLRMGYPVKDHRGAKHLAIGSPSDSQVNTVPL